MMFTAFLVGVSALNLRRPIQKQALVTNQVSAAAGMVRVGGCTHNPGAGMDASKHSETIYKDGYFHIRCMMDKMESEADWHNAQTREHEYSVKTNVTIVRYTDRVDVEAQRKMTPRVCFDFCRTVPEMLYYGLTAGRECYCTPYYHQGTGDGSCTAQCEGDATKTCGNTDGMSDVYEMHSCGDAVEEAEKSVTNGKEAIAYAKELHYNASAVVAGFDQQYDRIDVAEIRHPMQKAASALNKPTMAIERKFTECEEEEGVLTSTLSGVSAGSTSAAEVLKVEKEERNLKACIDALQAEAKALKKHLDSLKNSAVLGNAGVSFDQLHELGKTLLQKFPMNPMSAEVLAMWEEPAQCKIADATGPDCAGALYYWASFGRKTSYVTSYSAYEEVTDESNGYDEFAADATLFCLDMCADEPNCNHGYIDFFEYDYPQWGNERGWWCGLYQDAEDATEDDVLQYLQVMSYDDQYRWGSSTFMLPAGAEKVKKRGASTVNFWNTLG